MSSLKYKVMVVDDDESICNSLCKLLASEGYQVISAPNGAEAVDTFHREQNQIDLLLVDLNMPIRNGWVTLNQLMEINPSLPVFILTGLSNQNELAEAAGVSALVEKPIDVPRLVQLIQKQLVGSALLPLFQPTGHRVFPFYWLRAARDAQRAQWGELPVTPYDHWGLNE